jgi:hypothetical protein
MKKICVSGIGLPQGAVASAIAAQVYGISDHRNTDKKQKKQQAREAVLRQRRLDKLNDKK